MLSNTSLATDREAEAIKASRAKLPTIEDATAAMRTAVMKSNVQELPEPVLSTVFDGLNIYFSERFNPLPVKDLLFYWQD